MPSLNSDKLSGLLGVCREYGNRVQSLGLIIRQDGNTEGSGRV